MMKTVLINSFILLGFFSFCLNAQTTTDKHPVKTVGVGHKSEQQKADEEKHAKQKAGMAASKAEDEAAMKAEDDKAKEHKRKQEEGLKKSQAEDEAAIKADDEKAKERKRKQEEGLKKSQEDDAAAIKADQEKAKQKRVERDKETAERKTKQEQAQKEAKAEEAAQFKKELDEMDAKQAEKEKKAEEARKRQVQEDMKDANVPHSIPQTIGAADQYKEKIKKADELFKMKRYAEAKPVYEEALKLKDKDPYSTSKLAEIEKMPKK